MDKWRGGRVVEGARLESVCTLTGTVGSNPTLSAKYLAKICNFLLDNQK